MANINLPAELEIKLRQLIKDEKEFIVTFRKSKHKEPSLIDAFLYYLHIKNKQIDNAVKLAELIIKSKTLDEAKQIASTIELFDKDKIGS